MTSLIFLGFLILFLFKNNYDEWGKFGAEI